MMAEQQTSQYAFQALLSNLYMKADGEAALQRIKAKAWDHFLELGLPTRQDEVYRYVRLRSLYARQFAHSISKKLAKEAIAPYILPECTQSVLVFVNGYFTPSLSNMDALPKKIVVSTIAQSMQTFGGFLNSQWSKSLKEERDPFAALNMALQQEGIFFYAPPKTVIEVPVQLLNVIDADADPMFINPRLQAFVGSQSQLSLVSTLAVLSGQQYAINMFTDLALEDEAHVKCTQVACGQEGIWHFDALRASLKRNSSLKVIAATDGAETVRYDYRVSLNGENAEALLNGVWLLKGKKEAHTHVLMDHQAPYCRSMQLYKGVLNDVSRSSFEGKILVQQAAQKTEAFQLNNNLLLSERANADSKPNLEIFADDVKASHGATVGQLDKEQIFYMKTRGFHESAAKNLLINGFCQEVIDMVPIESLRQDLKKLSENYLTL